MAGGQRIDDHSSWVGARGKNVPYPDGAKMKQYSSSEGAGHQGKYEDTSEAIKAQQDDSVSKAKSRPVKANYRN